MISVWYVNLEISIKEIGSLWCHKTILLIVNIGYLKRYVYEVSQMNKVSSKNQLIKFMWNIKRKLGWLSNGGYEWLKRNWQNQIVLITVGLGYLNHHVLISSPHKLAVHVKHWTTLERPDTYKFKSKQTFTFLF